MAVLACLRRASPVKIGGQEATDREGQKRKGPEAEMNLAGAFEGPKRLKLEHGRLKEEVSTKPDRYMGFMPGHGKESGFCYKCTEGHLDIKLENNEIYAAF